MDRSLVLALMSTGVFAFSSVIFAVFAKKVSAIWMNAFKATVALVAFSVAVLITGDWKDLPAAKSLVAFVLSGFIGLNLGDYFLMKAFQRIGSSRTLIIFSFQPLMMALFAYLVFGQSLFISGFIAILMMMACVFTVSLEGYKKDGHWEIKGPLFAFIGVSLDCVGLLLTRYAFDADDSVSVLEGNLFRCFGAGLGFLFLARFVRFQFKRRLQRFNWRTRALLFGASFGGTFLALWLYLSAISEGHLAKITAIVGSGPLFTAVFEALLYRKFPSKYLWVALGLFLVGFSLLHWNEWAPALEKLFFQLSY